MGEAPYSVTDRRPITARHWRVFQRLAGWLARRGVSANTISLAGLGCGVAAGLALAATGLAPEWERVGWLAGAALIQLRLLANMLDGMVAVESGRASPVGVLYNEVPDRLSDVATLVGAGYGVGGDMVLGFAAGLAALLTAYVRAMGKAAGAPQEFCGPMAKQQRMFLVTVIAVYCGLAAQDWKPTWGSPPSCGLMAAGLLIVVVGGLLTALRRLARIARALRRVEP